MTNGSDNQQQLEAAESLARQLDRAMGVLGILVTELLLRAYVARFQASLWRKMVADDFSGAIILTVLQSVPGPMDLTRYTRW